MPSPRARGVSASQRAAPTLRSMQQVFDVSNDVAAELAAIGDGVLEALRERLRVTIRLRGNRLTIEGDDERVTEARAVVDELVELAEGGHEIGPSTVDAVLGALDQVEDVREVFEDVVWRHRGKKIAPKTVTQKRYVDAIRDCAVTFRYGRRGRARRIWRWPWRSRRSPIAKWAGSSSPARSRPRAARLPPGDDAREGRPVPAPALRRPLRHARRRPPRRYTERASSRFLCSGSARRHLQHSFIILDEAQNTRPSRCRCSDPPRPRVERSSYGRRDPG